MKLTKKEIKHIADLARLDLNPEELKLYRSQLTDILNYINQLKEVDTRRVEPTAQITGLENVLRVDKVADWDKNEKEAALNQAPELEDRQIKVKRILE